MSPRSLAPTWAETFHDLQSASTEEELWRILLDWHGIRSSSAWEEPYLLFMRFHRQDSTNAEVTAVLLCTDYRWRNASHHLIDRLCESLVLDGDQLDSLADWFSGEMFELVLEASRPRRGGDATVRRPIWPPLRRWAARHRVQRRPDRWRELIDESTALPSRDSAATVAGVMDAAEHVPPDDRPALAAIGVGHGSGTVRLAALPMLASTAGTDVAIARAQRDQSAKVRAWKPRDASRTEPSEHESPTSSSPEARGRAGGQASLFD